MRLASAIVPFLLALPALSAPAIEASCLKAYSLCLDTARGLSQEQFRSNPFGISKECTLVATCFPSSPDEFLVAANAALFPGSNNPPKSVNSPRLTQALYNTLAPPGQTANQQSYIDAYYSLLATVGGPYPPASQVGIYWTKIGQWTGFCSGEKAIPYQNLADWFQCSDTVSAPPGPCEVTTSSAASSVMISASTTITPTTAFSSSASTPLLSSTLSSAPPVVTSSVPAEASCAKIYSVCVGDVRDIGEGAWRSAPFGVSKACTLAATCYSGGPDAFLFGVQVVAFIESSQPPPQEQSVPRFPQSLYNTLTTPGNIADQQSYIDAYYSFLSSVGGPYPINTVVIGYWEAISAWTGFCSSRSVPYENLADWFQWSSVVAGPVKC